MLLCSACVVEDICGSVGVAASLEKTEEKRLGLVHCDPRGERAPLIRESSVLFRLAFWTTAIYGLIRDCYF
jgi:hypothetical protein